MKTSTSFSFLFLLVGFIPCVVFASSLEAHAAERVLYYLNYLAEEEYNLADGATRQYSIAPACVGTRTGGRCTFSEFLLHIWGEQTNTGDIKPPTKFNIPPTAAADITTESLADLVNGVIAARTNQQGTKKVDLPITGNTNDAKLWPSDPQGDYYDILGKMGQKINQLTASRGTTEATDIQKRIETMGKAAAQAVVDLRWEDNEKPRLKGMKKLLGFAMSTRKYTVAIFGRTFDMLDAAKTIADNPGKATDAILAKAAIDFVNLKNNNVFHWKAITSAQSAAINVGCKIPTNAAS